MIHGQDELFIIVGNRFERSQLAASRIFIHDRSRDLDIFFLICFFCNEVDFQSPQFSDTYLVVSAEEFKVDKVFENVPIVCVSETE